MLKLLFWLITGFWPKLGRMRPGRCECSHNRCSHEKGKDGCLAACTGDQTRYCACVIYIRAEEPKEKKDTEVQELRKIAGL